MYRIWFDRPCPGRFAPLLAGLAVATGPGLASSDGTDGVQAIIASARTRYDAAQLDRFPQLRVISRTGAGYDNIDVAAATARGIVVCHAPDAPTISTAEHTLALLLALAKRLKPTERALRQGNLLDFFESYTGIEIAGRQLGVVGLGRIGRRVAQMATALGMRVVAYDPYLPPAQRQSLPVRWATDLASLLQSSDFVSLHVPLTPETRHIINGTTIAWMKPGSFLINCARGGLVDEAALLAALESGHLAGAGLDVFEVEPPPPDHPLLHRDDVIATPHVAAATDAGRDRLWRTAITQALQVLRGERPPFVVNPEVWDQTLNSRR